MRYNDFHLNIKEIGATGGGAHKFAEMWDTVLGISMAKQDEMDSLVAGMQFVLADIDGECYTFKPCDWVKDTFDQVVDDGPLIGSMLNSSNTQNGIVASNDRTRSLSSFSSDWNVGEGERSLRSHASAEEQRPRIDQWWTSKKVEREPAFSDLYPYLLVSIGTGVSILRVDGPRKHERISGSTIGGGTYWGLCRLLTGSDSFSAVLDLASKGDPSKVDMMVGDIYGEGSNALEKLGLRSDIVASSFGKLVTKQNPSEGIKEEDLARALLLMVTNNIGQVAHLNAKLYKTSRIYFIGTFLQHNIISQQRLAYSIDYWSQGQMEALFLKHEAYFGALGAFLLNQGIEHKKQVAPPIKTRKRRHPTRANVSHQRSKSMGSIQL
jgi:pantothenate kinase